jgi:hypothetical protein
VVHTGTAADILSDDALTRRLLGVHAETAPARTAEEGSS